MSGDLLLFLTLVAGAAAFAALAGAAARARAGGAPRWAQRAGVGVAVLFVLVATLLPSSPDEGSKLRLDPTDGLDQLQALGNVLLFAPLGGFLALLGLSARRTAIAAALLSAAVEAVQFLVVTGRYAATGDVILNTAGAVLGRLALGAAVRTGVGARRRS